jgi:exonuclease III
LAYQPPANSTFLSDQTSQQQPASSTFLSEQTSTSQTNRLNITWWLSCVYGPQDNQAKLQFPEELRDLRTHLSGPWLVAGDFNLIYKDEDKNNPNLNKAMMGRFRRWINDMAVSELPLHGRKFTWSTSSTSANPTLVKLDRVFCSPDWEDIFRSATYKAHPRTTQIIAR